MKFFILLSLSTLAVVKSAPPPTTAVNRCKNDHDIDQILKTSETFGSVAERCGKKSFGMKAGAWDCIEKELKYSRGCAECFGDVTECTRSNCMRLCMWGRTEACEACSVQHCEGPLMTCTGLAKTELPGQVHLQPKQVNPVIVDSASVPKQRRFVLKRQFFQGTTCQSETKLGEDLVLSTVIGSKGNCINLPYGKTQEGKLFGGTKNRSYHYVISGDKTKVEAHIYNGENCQDEIIEAGNFFGHFHSQFNEHVVVEPAFTINKCRRFLTSATSNKVVLVEEVEEPVSDQQNVLEVEEVEEDILDQIGGFVNNKVYQTSQTDRKLGNNIVKTALVGAATYGTIKLAKACVNGICKLVNPVKAKVPVKAEVQKN
eukprot:Pgem_evm1s19477